MWTVLKSALKKWALLLALAAASASPAALADDALIAVASNFKSTAEALEHLFEEESAHDVAIVPGATGKLYAQIRNGAPYDVFLSADAHHPERLLSDGIAIDGTAFTYATGRLTLWSPDRADTGPHWLTDPDTRFVAIANPNLAPYGAAAVDALKTLDPDGRISGKLVRGESIGQAFAFVHSGNADVGFVALSQVLTLPEGARGYHWDVPTELYRPVHQDAVQLRRSRNNPSAQAFLAFLASDAAREVIQEHGYTLP